jgi:hypothetical protein
LVALAALIKANEMQIIHGEWSTGMSERAMTDLLIEAQLYAAMTGIPFGKFWRAVRRGDWD